MTASAQASVQPRSRLLRGFYFLVGVVSLMGVAVSFLPGIPTADLVVVALFFFARSSPRFEGWLRSRPFVQRVLHRYEGGLTRATKIQATAGIILSLGLSAWILTDNKTLRTLLGFVGLYALWFVWSRRAKDAAAMQPAA